MKNASPDAGTARDAGSENPRRDVGACPPLVCNTAEAALFLRCSEPLVREYIREGRIRAVKIGRSYRITRDALEALLAGAAIP